MSPVRLDQEVETVLELAQNQAGLSLSAEQREYLRRLIREVGLFAYSEGRAARGLADVVRFMPRKECLPTIGADEFPPGVA
jgi:hypothetical protein